MDSDLVAQLDRVERSIDALRRELLDVECDRFDLDGLRRGRRLTTKLRAMIDSVDADLARRGRHLRNGGRGLDGGGGAGGVDEALNPGGRQPESKPARDSQRAELHDQLAEQVAADCGIERLQRQRRQRSARLWDDLETGMSKLFAQFDPETAARIKASVQAEIDRLYRQRRDDPTDRRTREQLMADALANLICGARSGRHHGTDLIVLIDLHTLIHHLNHHHDNGGTPDDSNVSGDVAAERDDHSNGGASDDDGDVSDDVAADLDVLSDVSDGPACPAGDAGDGDAADTRPGESSAAHTPVGASSPATLNTNPEPAATTPSQPSSPPAPVPPPAAEPDLGPATDHPPAHDHPHRTPTGSGSTCGSGSGLQLQHVAGRRVCQTGDGTRLPVEAVRRMACNANIIPTVLSGKGVVLDQGRRTRLATREQRLALRAMYDTLRLPRFGGRVGYAAMPSPRRYAPHYTSDRDGPAAGDDPVAQQWMASTCSEAENVGE